MKNHIYILTIIFFAICSTRGYSATCEEIHLGQYQNNIIGTFRFCSKEAAITKTPDWNGQLEKIPLAIDKAINIGKKWVKSNNTKFERFIISGIQISRVGRSDLDNHWFYTLQFRPEGYRFFIPVVILMDGSIVEPIKY